MPAGPTNAIHTLVQESTLAHEKHTGHKRLLLLQALQGVGRRRRRVVCPVYDAMERERESESGRGTRGLASSIARRLPRCEYTKGRQVESAERKPALRSCAYKRVGHRPAGV